MLFIELCSGKCCALRDIWQLLLGIFQYRLPATSLGSFMLVECVKEDVTHSSVLTHEQQGQTIEESANVSQEPHQDCKLKNDVISTPSRTLTDGLISLTFLD